MHRGQEEEGRGFGSMSKSAITSHCEDGIGRYEAESREDSFLADSKCRGLPLPGRGMLILLDIRCILIK
jgi:hypothetical protein